MAQTKLQATQVVLHDQLSEIGNAADEQFNGILDKINTNLKVPGMLSMGAGKVINVGSTTLVKSNSVNVRLALGDTDLGGLSGSIDFANGTVTGQVQATTCPTMTASYFVKAGFEIRSDQQIYIVWGTQGASSSAAGFPNWSNVSVALGYVLLQDNGTGGQYNFNTPTNSSIFLVEGSGGSGQLSDHTLLTNRDSASQHPTTAIATTTGEFTGSQELSATEDEVQKALVRLSKYDSVFDWTNGYTYRVGNIVKVAGTNGTTAYRCITAHTASGSFDDAKFELLVSAQNHNTLANKNASSAHPTTSIDTVTGDFAGSLDANETTSQLAFVRLEQFNSCFDWVTSKAYRVGNIVKQSGTIYRCIVAHTSGTFATDLSGGKWELAISAQDHNTLANRTAASAHPASSIDTTTTNFDTALSSTEDTVQKAFDRLDDYASVKAWTNGYTYRVNNVVISGGHLWRCATAHTASGSFDATKFVLLIDAAQEEVQTVGVGGQTVFTLSTVVVPTGASGLLYSKLMVFINGILQLRTTHYTVDTATQVTFSQTIPQNAQVMFRVG